MRKFIRYYHRGGTGYHVTFLFLTQAYLRLTSEVAEVVGVGPGKLGDDGKRVPLDVKVGDRILFSKYAGTEINIDDVEHLFMKEEDILGVLV